MAEHVATHDLMLALVAAGYGIGFSSAAHISACKTTDVVARPLAGHSIMLTTYLLRPDIEPSEQLSSFIRRASKVAT